VYHLIPSAQGLEPHHVYWKVTIRTTPVPISRTTFTVRLGFQGPYPPARLTSSTGGAIRTHRLDEMTSVRIASGSPFTIDRQCTHYERAPWLRQSASATDACGGFAPTPPGFGALVPLPIWSFSCQIAKGGCRSIPLNRSRPLSRRSGCFPALPYPPLSPGLIVLRLQKAGVFAAGSGSMTLDLGGSGPSEESLSPQGGTQHAE
jgi:hypothetical protein